MTLQLRTQSGFNLIELMITVVIFALITTIGVPAFRNFNAKIEARADISKIYLTLQVARSHAINKSKFTTLCGVEAGRCSKNWGKNLTLFEDSNQNRIIDPNDIVIQRLPDMGSDFKELRFNRTHLTYRPSGRSPSSAGSLTYCFKSAVPHSKAWVIAASGRIRPGTDKNKNGIEETGNGRDIQCEPLRS